MPKVDPESGEPMSDDPEGPEETAGGKVNIDPRDSDNPDSSDAGGGGST